MKKGRIWACVGYPESLSIDWLDRLQETGLSIAISPLHDKDVDPTREIKKAHYHIIFNYEGPTTFKHVSELCKNFNFTIPIKLESLRGMYRYHLHLDNPDKYQYDDRDRILLNAFDPKSVDALTATETDKITNEVLNFIDDNDILYFHQLIKVYLDNEMYNFLSVVKSHAYLFTTYLKSKRDYKKKLSSEAED